MSRVPSIVLELKQPNERLQLLRPIESLSVGRDDTNGVRLTDLSVSKKHAVFQRCGASWSVQDRGSSNGTKVNGERITERMLVDGDVVEIGAAHFKVYMGPSQADSPYFAQNDLAPGWRTVMDLARPVSFAQDDLEVPASRDRQLDGLIAENHRIKVALELSLSMGLEEDLPRLLGKVLDFCMKIMHVDAAAGIVVSPATNEMEIRVIRQKVESEEPLQLSRSVLAEACALRHGRLLRNALVEAPALSVVSAQIRSILVIPVCVGEKTRAALYLDNRSLTGAFTEADLQLMDGIAGQAAKAIERYDLLCQIRKETETRAFLSRFISPILVESVRSGRDLQALGRERHQVVTVYADLRNFSTLCETASIEDVESLLDDCFGSMDTVIRRHGGALDKYIGDALMAIWVARGDGREEACAAVRCAWEMQEEMALLVDRRRARGQEAVEMGIGVHVGPALVGFVGGGLRRDFTAHGDAVNVAARMSGLALARSVLVSRDLIHVCRGLCRVGPMQSILVKGRKTELEVTTLLGLEAISIAPPA